LKALCEQAVEQAMPGRALNIRPGLIVGPHDPTGRFTYWPVRVARGTEVLAPGRQQRQIQFIDARDLAEWTIRMAEARQTGVFNATGPDSILTMGELLEECREVARSDARFTWANDKFLTDAGVEEWTELPLWLSEAAPDTPRGFMSVNCAKAITHGLTFRPLAYTVRDTLDWASKLSETLTTDTSYGAPRPKAGMEPEREAQVLKEWHEAQAAEAEHAADETAVH
jgi:2'-hydroxyisoflavone reductase